MSSEMYVPAPDPDTAKAKFDAVWAVHFRNKADEAPRLPVKAETPASMEAIKDAFKEGAAVYTLGPIDGKEMSEDQLEKCWNLSDAKEAAEAHAKKEPAKAETLEARPEPSPSGYATAEHGDISFSVSPEPSPEVVKLVDALIECAHARSYEENCGTGIQRERDAIGAEVAARAALLAAIPTSPKAPAIPSVPCPTCHLNAHQILERMKYLEEVERKFEALPTAPPPLTPPPQANQKPNLRPLEEFIPELLELAREEGHDDPKCPEDDTCRCANIARLNAELKAVQLLRASAEAPALTPPGGDPKHCLDCEASPMSMLGRLCDTHYIQNQKDGESIT